MRTNLKTWMLLGALSLGATAMAAQPERGRATSVEQRVARMREGLGLSDQQASQIEAILRDAAAKRETFEKSGQAKSREGMAQRQEVRRQIDAVLTPQQREKRDKIAAEHKQKRGGRRDRS